jgi:MYXO-CTERM domain-containing protein
MSTNGTTPEQIEAEIERQREELADTVDQLQARLDVKARAKHRAAVLRDQLTTASGAPRPDLTAAAAAALVLVVGVVVLRRRRR